MKLLVTTVIAVLSTSCSVAFQDSVRSSGYDCSTSYGWAAGDLVLAGANAFVASRGTGLNEQPGYVLPAEVMTGVFVASAVIGAYKAHHCASYLEDPAVIAQIDADRVRMAEAAARGRAEAEAAAAACAAQGGCSTDSSTESSTDASADQGPTCPDGQLLGGPSWDRCYTCPAGASIGGFANGECICPEGTTSNGTVCVAPSGEPAPVPTHHHHAHTQIAAPQPQPVHVDVQIQTAPRTQVYQAPPPNPSYHALFQATKGGDMKSCQVFDHDASNMGACSSYCTGMLMQKLKCQCVAGGC